MLDESVVPGPLLQYKNTSRLARGDDVDVVELYTYGNSAITHSQAYVVETARDRPRAAVSHVYESRSSCWGLRK